MACQATYEAKRLNPGPACSSACAGCTFSSSVTAAVIDDGCTFDYTVTPSGACTSSSSTGTVNLACPGQTTLTFYCDAGGACPAFEIKFKCHPEPAGGE